MKYVLTILLLLWGATQGHAQWAVKEVWSEVQLFNTIKNGAESVKQTLKQVEQYTKQLEQIQNEFKMINQQKDQILQMTQSLKNEAQNLERLPGSIQASLMGSGNKLTGLLSAIGKVNNATSQATQQFDSVYAKFAQSGTSADMIAARLAMLKARRSAVLGGVESSSIAQSVTEQFDKLRILLSNSFTNKGNLDAQQIAHQQQALLANIQLQQQTMEAAMARAVYEEKAEAVVLSQMRLQMIQQATTYIDTSKPYVTEGKFADYEKYYPRR